MVKAGSSFQSIYYGGNGGSEEHLCRDKVADIMARYYARIDKTVPADALETLQLSEKQIRNNVYRHDNMPENTDAQNQTESLAVLLERKHEADSRNLENINRSRLKMKHTNTVLEKLGREMKKLEYDGDFLRTVRNNLDEMDRNFWDWLL